MTYIDEIRELADKAAAEARQKEADASKLRHVADQLAGVQPFEIPERDGAGRQRRASKGPLVPMDKRKAEVLDILRGEPEREFAARDFDLPYSSVDRALTELIAENKVSVVGTTPRNKPKVKHKASTVRPGEGIVYATPTTSN